MLAATGRPELRKTRHIAVVTSFTTLALAVPAGAGGPSTAQYGNPGEEGPPVPTGKEVEFPGSGPLPFTGLQAGLVLLGGLVVGASGLALRRFGGEEHGAPLTEPPRELDPGPIEAARAAEAENEVRSESAPREEGVRLARCETCGKEFDAKRYQIVVPGVAGVFDTIACALGSDENGLSGRRT